MRESNYADSDNYTCLNLQSC